MVSRFILVNSLARHLGGDLDLEIAVHKHPVGTGGEMWVRKGNGTPTRSGVRRG